LHQTTKILLCGGQVMVMADLKALHERLRELLVLQSQTLYPDLRAQLAFENLGR
jgi:hypothetical protein